MPTPVFLCSAQCGVLVPGTKSTLRHWNAFTGTITVESSIVPYTGAKAYKFVSAAAGTGRLEKTGLSGTYRTVCVRFRWEDLPAARTIVIEIGGADAVNGAVAYDPAANGGLGGFTARAGAGTDQTWGTTPLVDTWYHLDVAMDTSGAATRTVSWAVEDAVQTDATVAVGAASTVSYVRHGMVNSAAAVRTGYMSDILHSTTSADFPIALHRTEALVPTSDGTHSFTAGDFAYNSAGANISTSATDVWTYVDDPVDNITDFVRQAVIRTTGYLEVQLNDPTSTDDPWGAVLVGGYHASATGANQAGTRWFDGTSEATAYGGVIDVSDVTLDVQEDVRATAPSGAWTNALASALRLRFGFSGDVVGIPYFGALRVEMAFPEPGGAPPANPPRSTQMAQLLAH